MSKTPEQMRKKMASKSDKLAGKLGGESKQQEVAEKFAAEQKEEEK